MTAPITELARRLRAALSGEGLEAARRHVEAALHDPAFLAAAAGPERTVRREVLYEDAALGFCICVHTYQGEAIGQPHDHGPTWAIYGQAEGETEMTEWDIVTPRDGDTPARVTPRETYVLKPGMARTYDVGVVHSPKRLAPTRLIRIEGQNLDTIERTPIVAAQG